MLPRTARLSRSSDFNEVVRRGRRASRGTVTAHLLLQEVDAPARAGLVVSKGVGGSVVRHAVARRLRHLLRDRITRLPAGSRLVVRAAPSAASASSAELGADLDAAFDRLLRPSAPAVPRTPR